MLSMIYTNKSEKSPISDTEKCTLTDEKEMKKIMAIDAKWKCPVNTMAQKCRLTAEKEMKKIMAMHAEMPKMTKL